jgi:predicted dehydrogenase
MPDRKLRAVVIGAGWAGEGHTNALRHYGIEVVAICARKADVVQAVADRLQVPEASTDWRQTLETVRPEIVALATPAVLRREVIETAAGIGAHIFCDKPLAATAEEASSLFQCVDQAGVKHAYAATHSYEPSIEWAAELLGNNIIGQLQTVDCLQRFSPGPELRPWTWMDSLTLGGGMLNNGFTHVIAMLEKIVGSQVIGVAGEARMLHRRRPVVPALHDIRQRGEYMPTAEEAAHLEWRDCDADTAFFSLLRFAAPSEDQPPIQVNLTVDFESSSSPFNGWYFYGTEGVLKGNGVTSLSISHYENAEPEGKSLPTPQRLLDRLPQIGDDTQNKWAALARDFVADIRGEPHEPYLTFRDGWRYQEAIDAIRAGRGWHDLPV